MSQNFSIFVGIDISKDKFNAYAIQNPTSVGLRKTKTDKIDARSIALTIFYTHYLLPASSFLNSDFRDIARKKESITHQISKVKNDIEKLLSLLFPELEKVTNIYNDAILDLLSSFPSAKAIQKASIDSLRVFFSKTTGRKLKLSPETLKELANNSIAQ